MAARMRERQRASIRSNIAAKICGGGENWMYLDDIDKCCDTFRTTIRNHRLLIAFGYVFIGLGSAKNGWL
jgi:hypothetical protein